jgi:hypothetical protein
MFTMWTLAVLGGLNFLSAYVTRAPAPAASFTFRNVTSLRTVHSTDMLGVKFDLQADLRPLYTWNLKQIFLAVEFEVFTQNRSARQIVYD